MLFKKIILLLLMVVSVQSAFLQGSKPVANAAGKALYNKACLSCHQADGSGVGGINPPLIKTPWVLGDKKKLINIILKGMNQPIEFDGERYENVMPPQPTLSDQQIADILTYVRSSFGNKASAVTVAEVKAVRATKK